MAKPKKTDWDPNNTLVLVLGLGLEEWADPDDSDWKRHETLASFFRQAGVPADQVLLWEDGPGHPEKVRAALPEFLQNSDEETLFVFYYAGHGSKDSEEDDFYFCHPASEDDWLSQSELFELIEDNFNGYQVLLLADCCHSGSLAREVAVRETEYYYAALTSSTSDRSSTGNWTFTDCVLGALRGEMALDANADGTVSFGELCDHVVRQMREVEKQPADFQATDGFNRSFRLAITRDLAKAKRKWVGT